MARTSRRQRARDERAFLGRCGSEARAQPRATCVGAHLPPGLGIDEPEHPRVRELLLAGIPDLDRDDLVPTGEFEQRAAPVERATEVAHDDGDRALTSKPKPLPTYLTEANQKPLATP